MVLMVLIVLIVLIVQIGVDSANGVDGVDGVDGANSVGVGIVCGEVTVVTKGVVLEDFWSFSSFTSCRRTDRA